MSKTDKDLEQKLRDALKREADKVDPKPALDKIRDKIKDKGGKK